MKSWLTRWLVCSWRGHDPVRRRGITAGFLSENAAMPYAFTCSRCGCGCRADGCR